jgi:hypothetical protein
MTSYDDLQIMKEMNEAFQDDVDEDEDLSNAVLDISDVEDEVVEYNPGSSKSVRAVSCVWVASHRFAVSQSCHFPCKCKLVRLLLGFSNVFWFQGAIFDNVQTPNRLDVPVAEVCLHNLIFARLMATSRHSIMTTSMRTKTHNEWWVSYII